MSNNMKTFASSPSVVHQGLESCFVPTLEAFQGKKWFMIMQRRLLTQIKVAESFLVSIFTWEKEKKFGGSADPLKTSRTKFNYEI